MRALLVVGLIVAVGCSSSNSEQKGGSEATASQQEIMNEVGQLLRSYPPKGGKGPTKLADLAAYEAGGPIGYAAIKSGDVVVVWGSAMAGEGEVASGGGTEVVAYEKKTPTEGGLVLLANGQVKSMTAAEFSTNLKK